MVAGENAEYVDIWIQMLVSREIWGWGCTEDSVVSLNQVEGYQLGGRMGEEVLGVSVRAEDMRKSPKQEKRKWVG